VLSRDKSLNALFNCEKAMAEKDSFDDFVDDLLEKGEERHVEEQKSEIDVLLCSTPIVPGRKILKIRGLVSGRIVKGQGFWTNLKMAFGSDSFGKRSGALEADFQKMEYECFRQLKVAAQRKGANAVIGVSLQFGETSGEANLFYAVALGTAAIID